MSFFHRAAERARQIGAPLCLGLDPRDENVERFSHTSDYEILYSRHIERMTAEGFRNHSPDSIYMKLKLYCEYLLESTSEHVCCVKPNLAFFIAHGPEGIQALMDVCGAIRDMNMPIIMDAKLGDIGSTMEYYKRFIFTILKADCCTVNTMLGTDVLKVMASSKKSQYVNDLFVLAKCSNPSSSQVQGAMLENKKPLYLEIISQCETFYEENHITTAKIGYVVGATCIQALKDIRQEYPDCIILMPGIGAQGGDLAASLKAARNKDGGGVIVPISRAIIDEPKPSEAVLYWKEQIKLHLAT